MLWEHIWLHSSVVEGFQFSEVNDVQFDFGSSCIFDFEVKPLDMATGIGIDPHKQIIFIFSNLYDSI